VLTIVESEPGGARSTAIGAAGEGEGVIVGVTGLVAVWLGMCVADGSAVEIAEEQAVSNNTRHITRVLRSIE
jgi:hypothetical protein